MRLAALALLAACSGGGAVEAETVIAVPRRAPEPVYSEGERHLRRLKDATERYAKVNGAFPVGVAPATPAASCCESPGSTCAADAAAWGGVWRDLDFSVEEPHHFRISYESADGTAFTATAASDLDCDGEESLYILQGTLTDGTLRYGLMRPPSDD